LILLVIASVLGTWKAADARLWELRFSLNNRVPTGDVVFVDIDSSSLHQVGLWPWPRSLHGQLLDRLIDMGAYEVAFDIDFSTRSTPAEDAAFAESLERAGGYAYLAAFEQRDALGRDIWNFPIEAFGAFAEAALVNVNSLEAGMVWSLPGRGHDGLKSIAGHFTPEQEAPETLRIDYAVDLSRIVRIPAAQILDGTADPGLVRDRQIVVGASALELHDLLLVPRFGIVPGPMVQIAAAETLKLDRALLSSSPWPVLILATIFLLASTFLPRARWDRVVIASLALSIMLELSAFYAYARLGIALETTVFHVAVFGVLFVRLMEERLVRRQQLREQHAKLVFLANHDTRTGALSQSAWLSAIAGRIGLQGRVSIILVRLENLENTGASLGFQLVDGAIEQVYQRLSSMVGLVGRIETDMFALAFDDAPRTETLERILAAVELPNIVQGHSVVLQSRWGQSEAEVAIGADIALKRARTALAMAVRRNSKGAVYEKTFDADFHFRQTVDLALREAISRNELDLAFQLQIDLHSRQTSGAEALLRWKGAEIGSVSPAVFIPLAEENGTIVELGRWVAVEALRRAMAQQWSGRISINVSPIQFERSDVVEMVSFALRESGFPAERLDIEITESLIAGGETSIIETLAALQALGASIAIDDFGTGHSSLSHLALLPVDKIKIDQSFVRQLAMPKGAEVVDAIVDLGRRLGMTVVVEGVETEEEFAVLADLGCHLAQGFLFGRPGPLPTPDSSPDAITALGEPLHLADQNALQVAEL